MSSIMRGMETDGQLAERISSAEQPSSSLHEHHRHHHSDEAGASSERKDGEIPAEDSPPHPHADYEPPLTDNPSITGGRGEALTNEPRSGKRPFERDEEPLARLHSDPHHRHETQRLGDERERTTDSRPPPLLKQQQQPPSAAAENDRVKDKIRDREGDRQDTLKGPSSRHRRPHDSEEDEEEATRHKRRATNDVRTSSRDRYRSPAPSLPPPPATTHTHVSHHHRLDDRLRRGPESLSYETRGRGDERERRDLDLDYPHDKRSKDDGRRYHSRDRSYSPRRHSSRDRERERDREDERERDDHRRRHKGSDRDKDRESEKERDRDRSGKKKSKRRDRGREEEEEEEEEKHKGSSKDNGKVGKEEEEEDAMPLIADGLDEEAEEQRRIEERRRRLQEIKAKHQASQQSLPLSSSAPSLVPLASPPAQVPPPPATTASALPPSAATAPGSGPGPAASLANDDEGGAMEEAPAQVMPSAQEGSSAVLLDETSPSESEEEEEEEDGKVLDIFEGGGEGEGAVTLTEAQSPDKLTAKEKEDKEEKEEEEEEDMFADKADEEDEEEEEEDMFAEEAPPRRRKATPGPGGGPPPDGPPTKAKAKAGPVAALQDAYDDPEGYYNFQVGEVMDGRYEVFASYGRGVFGSVVRARDLHPPPPLLSSSGSGSKEGSRGGAKGEASHPPSSSSAAAAAPTAGGGGGGRPHAEVAIKLIRSNEVMFKAAQTEIQILKLLGDADPHNHKHCVRLFRHFEYRSHMCLVFESMEMNLRDLTRKFGRNKGLSMPAVQLFTGQLLTSLRHLRRCRVIHADIKPDNILINHRHDKVKLCDFGSAMMFGDHEVTPYLVSRYYRAPEVILGMKYDSALDIWSIGCVIYELFTGQFLFPGRSNNEMLKLMMDVKGPFAKKWLKRGRFVDQHFESDQNMSFAFYEDDPITRTRVRKVIPTPTGPKQSILQLLQKSSGGRGGGTDGDRLLLAQLADLLEKMLMLEPEKRIDPETALKHPFVMRKTPPAPPPSIKQG